MGTFASDGAPGWYDFSHSDEVRWWTGKRWSGYVLKEGVPHIEMRGAQPEQALVMFTNGVVMFVLAALCTSTLALDLDTTMTVVLSVLSLLLVIIGIISLITGIRARKITRAPAPTSAPVVIDSVTPLPGVVEGPNAAWYPTPGLKHMRWWTGTRWTQYIAERGVVYPTHGMAAIYDKTLVRWRRIPIFGVVLCVLGVGMFLVPSDLLRGVGLPLSLLGMFFVVLAVTLGRYTKRVRATLDLDKLPPPHAIVPA